MNKYEKIKELSLEEMAELLTDISLQVMVKMFNTLGYDIDKDRETIMNYARQIGLVDDFETFLKEEWVEE